MRATLLLACLASASVAQAARYDVESTRVEVGGLRFTANARVDRGGAIEPPRATRFSLQPKLAGANCGPPPARIFSDGFETP